MRKLKVVTVVGTRPEIIRLSRVIAKLDDYCEHIIIHTGQNFDYELNQIFFEDLDIRKPDYFLNSGNHNSGFASTIGKIIPEVDKILESIVPDALLILGDTNSCLSVIAAKRRKIPIFHMEAGNRCFDQRVPEEINRRIIDHTADVNLTYSSIAREYLLSEGLPADLVIKTGSPMFEVLNYYKPKIQNSEILKKLKIEKQGYFLVSAHREENIDSPKNFSGLINILNFLAEEYQVPVIVSTHPRTQKKIDQEKLKLNQKIQLLKPLGFSDYVKLQVDAKVVLSDSGTINEESSILNFPALNLRDAHERPEAMEEGSVMMVGMNVERVHQALDVLKNQSQDQASILRQVSDYSMPNVSEKIVRIILSYTDYVNRVVWKKY